MHKLMSNNAICIKINLEIIGILEDFGGEPLLWSVVVSPCKSNVGGLRKEVKNAMPTFFKIFCAKIKK